jgi:hypothetical protein
MWSVAIIVICLMAGCSGPISETLREHSSPSRPSQASGPEQSRTQYGLKRDEANPAQPKNDATDPEILKSLGEQGARHRGRKITRRRTGSKSIGKSSLAPLLGEVLRISSFSSKTALPNA